MGRVQHATAPVPSVLATGGVCSWRAVNDAELSGLTTSDVDRAHSAPANVHGRRSPTLFRLAALSLLAAATTLMPGCALVDQFGVRAVDYNRQIDEAQNNGLLLNVMRAAYHQPLRYSDVTTINGQANIQGGAAAAVPLGGIRGSGPELYSLAPTFSLSGGPQFTVASLSTQDFYRGMLTPIAPLQVHWYVQSGISPSLLLTLFVFQIYFDEDNLVSVINNFEPTRDNKSLNYDNYATMLQALVELGLFTESVERPIAVGAPLSDVESKSLVAIKDLDAQGLKLVRHPVKDLPADQQAPFVAAGHYFQVEKPNTTYRFCFLKPKVTVATSLATLSRKQPPLAVNTPAGWMTIPDESFCGAKPTDGDGIKADKHLGEDLTLSRNVGINLFDVQAKKYVPASLRFKLRSVEQMIYYLGELARYQLALGRNPLLPVTPVAPCTKPLEVAIAGTLESCATLFTVVREKADPAISASYLGKDYFVPITSTGADRSGQTLEVITQLISLNKSVKDFPPPAIVPIIVP